METRLDSGIGIASFIISLLSGFGMLFVILVTGAMVASSPHALDEESIEAAVVGIFTLTFLFLSLIGLGLGLGGLCERRTRKTFAILGAIFSACTILGTLLLMLVGIAAG
jgi:hypothetical protein